MKKRLTSLIIALAIALSAVTIAPLGASAVKNSKIDEMTAVLSYLGIVSETEKIDLEQVVDRATFSQMMAVAIKADYNSGSIYFADVPKDHWANSYIGALTDLGIISLAEDRMFEPERAIKYAEACKMLVYALGYQKFVNSKGGGMERWIAQAADLDIVAGGNAEQITMATAIELIYEAMEAPMLAYESFPNTFIKDEDTTLFGTVHDVYRGRGIVQSTYGAYMQGTPLYDESKAMVSGDEYIVDETFDLKQFFGHEINFYYVHNASLEENKIFYAQSRSNNEIVEINGAFITSFDSDSYIVTYYETENARRTKSETIEKSAKIVLNGAPYSGSLKEAMDNFINEERRGTISLFSLDGSGFDFVNIKSYEAFITGSYDNERMLLSGEGKEFDLNDVKILTVKDDLGMDSDIGTIKNTVLNIARSEEKADGSSEIFEIIGSSVAQTVKVDSCSESDREITCGETTYKVDKRIWDTYAGRFTSLGSIQIKTDMFGYVVDIVKAAGVADSDWKIGYLISVKCFTENFDDYQIVFRLYTTDGRIEDLYFNEKVRIDEKSYNLSKNVYAVLDAIPGASYDVSESGKISLTVEDQVIQYKLNEDGKIKSIDTYNVSDKEDADFSLTRRWNRNGTMMLTSRYGLDTYYNAGTTCFTVPVIKASGEIEKNGNLVVPTEKDFSLTLENKPDKTYTLSVYNTNMSSIYSEILVRHASEETSVYSPIIFDTINQVWDEESEEAVYSIVGFKDGKEVEYYATEDVYQKFMSKDIEFGDLFHITSDKTEKYMYTVEKCLDAETLEFMGNRNGSTDPYWYYVTYYPGVGNDWTYRDPGTHAMMEKFWIYKKLSDGFMATYNYNDMFDDKYDVISATSGMRVIIVDRDNEYIEISSLSSVKDFCSSSAEQAISVTGWSGTTDLILYR